MTTLASGMARPYHTGNINSFPVIANDIIYQGSAVGDNASGYARPLVSGDPFRGFASASVDNSTGAAGAVNVDVYESGEIQLDVASVAITDVGKPVYATDDNAFALTGIGTKIGVVHRWISSGVCIVAFDASGTSSGGISTISFPVTLANIAGAGDVVTAFTPGFAGRIVNMQFVVSTAVTTGAKAVSLNAEIGTTNLTGGVVALTSANCTPLGATIAATAITGGAAFSATDTISIEAASVTAFAEGAGVLIVTLSQ